MIFVFGSNRLGIHGAGAAKHALDHCGAVYGKGEGLFGQSYALPTCERPGFALTLAQVKDHVEYFLKFARENPHLQFQVTRVGCGIAGFKDAEIAPLFRMASDNVWLPAEFAHALYWHGYNDGLDKALGMAADLAAREVKS